MGTPVATIHSPESVYRSGAVELVGMALAGAAIAVLALYLVPGHSRALASSEPEA